MSVSISGKFHPNTGVLRKARVERMLKNGTWESNYEEFERACYALQKCLDDQLAPPIKESVLSFIVVGEDFEDQVNVTVYATEDGRWAWAFLHQSISFEEMVEYLDTPLRAADGFFWTEDDQQGKQLLETIFRLAHDIRGLEFTSLKHYFYDEPDAKERLIELLTK